MKAEQIRSLLYSSKAERLAKFLSSIPVPVVVKHVPTGLYYGVHGLTVGPPNYVMVPISEFTTNVTDMVDYLRENLFYPNITSIPSYDLELEIEGVDDKAGIDSELEAEKI